MQRFLVLLVAVATLPFVGLDAAGASDDSTFSWGSAKACAVLSPTDVRCYPSEGAMEAATSRETSLTSSSTDSSTDDSTSTMSVSTSSAYCAGRSDLWLYLYEHPGFGGRVLKFRNTNYWQNLTDYGFNDQTSAWRNSTYCTVYLAEHIGGAGAWLSLPARSSSSYIGDAWNERVSSLYITS